MGWLREVGAEADDLMAIVEREVGRGNRVFLIWQDDEGYRRRGVRPAGEPEAESTAIEVDALLALAATTIREAGVENGEAMCAALQEIIADCAAWAGLDLVDGED